VYILLPTEYYEGCVLRHVCSESSTWAWGLALPCKHAAVSWGCTLPLQLHGSWGLIVAGSTAVGHKLFSINSRTCSGQSAWPTAQRMSVSFYLAQCLMCRALHAPARSRALLLPMFFAQIAAWLWCSASPCGRSWVCPHSCVGTRSGGFCSASLAGHSECAHGAHSALRQARQGTHNHASTHTRTQDQPSMCARASTVWLQLSDWADGALARRMGSSSVLGSYLDPLGDKVRVRVRVCVCVCVRVWMDTFVSWRGRVRTSRSRCVLVCSCLRCVLAWLSSQPDLLGISHPRPRHQPPPTKASARCWDPPVPGRPEGDLCTSTGHRPEGAPVHRPAGRTGYRPEGAPVHQHRPQGIAHTSGALCCAARVGWPWPRAPVGLNKQMQARGAWAGILEIIWPRVCAVNEMCGSVRSVTLMWPIVCSLECLLRMHCRIACATCARSCVLRDGPCSDFLPWPLQPETLSGLCLAGHTHTWHCVLCL